MLRPLPRFQGSSPHIGPATLPRQLLAAVPSCTCLRVSMSMSCLPPCNLPKSAVCCNKVTIEHNALVTSLPARVCCEGSMLHSRPRHCIMDKMQFCNGNMPALNVSCWAGKGQTKKP